MKHLVWAALIGVGCDSAPEPATCEGGGEPLVEIGEGGRSAFVPYSDGDVLPGSSSTVDFELWTGGLDTTQPVTAVVRVTAAGPTQDSIAQLTLTCADTGNGWTAVRAALPSDASSGAALTVEAVVTDAAGESASTTVAGSLE